MASERGYRGRLQLLRRPEAISLWEVVVAIQGPDWMGPCLLGLDDAPMTPPCPNEAFWCRICQEIQDELTQLTVADCLPPFKASEAPPQADAAQADSPSGVASRWHFFRKPESNRYEPSSSVILA